MKPIFAKILDGGEIATFATKEVCRPFFSTEFHFHSACQMTYIVQSEGTRIIGDSIDRFASGELTFVGPDLPHVWHNGQNQHAIVAGSHSLTLYIEPAPIIEAFGKFFKTHKIESFLASSKRGILFHGKTKELLKEKLEQIAKLDYGFEKTILLLEMIEIMVHSGDFEYICSPGYTHRYNPVDNEKIDRIFKYVFNNFSREITLDQVAKMSSMSKHSFCRYFRTRTQKTFVQFVNEVRISEACRLIAEDGLQITNIAYTCGFNSLSNFNKIFKSIKGITPSKYRTHLSE